MRMIRVCEGTTGEQGYERLFGGESFIRDYHKNFRTHPQIKITRKNKKTGRFIYLQPLVHIKLWDILGKTALLLFGEKNMVLPILVLSLRFTLCCNTQGESTR
ncbi:Uncharacterised protein [Salmonella enterica subsp. arizonae]|uniref:Uncharacterized protein n=1 Tax=Salmonella enterica subsp. arizonae TaxID=59203 RepID=A0A2X4TW94_SALER|nr:Uncharacterised protein [Salmonella enterica subsp. arizonae]